MKKLISMIMVVLLLASFAACSCNSREPYYSESDPVPGWDNSVSENYPESIDPIEGDPEPGWDNSGNVDYEQENMPSSVSVGDVIVFGAYEQDNDPNNGKEPIEWIVLNRNGDNALVISKYALDCQIFYDDSFKYGTDFSSFTWENSTMRKWLNSTFLQTAFDSAEQRKIKNFDADRVFLLTDSEAESLFASNDARKCAPTAYAQAQGAFVTEERRDDNGNVWQEGGLTFWSIRVPSTEQHTEWGVGFIDHMGYIERYVNDGWKGNAVRPAMWITLDSQGAANPNSNGGNTSYPSSTTAPASANTATVGDLSFDTVTLDGTPISAGIIRDYDLVMVNFWAEWCGPCINELPALERIHQEYPNVLVLGVLTWSNDVGGAKEALRDVSVTYPSIEVGGSFASFAEQFDGIPDTMFFDRNGHQVSSTVEGSRSYSEWKALVDSLLGGASSVQKTDDQFMRALSTAKKAGRHSVIAAGNVFVVGVKADGTCISSGSYIPNISEWTDIIAVSSNEDEIAGLRSDGHVLCSDTSLDVSGWNNIIQISYNTGVWVDEKAQHLVGLTSNGTVVAVGTNQYGECSTSGWNNIVDVAAGSYHTVGLRADGTVVACGDNQYGQCNVTEWKGIVDVAAARYSTYGLTADGEILVAGQYEETYQNFVPEVPHWNGVIAIIAGNEGGSAEDFVVGICRDGTIKTNRSGYLQDGEIESFSDVQVVAVSSWGYTVCMDSRGVAKDVGYDVDGERQVSNWPALMHGLSSDSSDAFSIPLSVSEGDIITFGSYNGKPIEWIVLTVGKGRIFMISKDAVADHVYDELISTDGTWENCTLRSWLNNEFFYNAFSSSERAMIPEVWVYAEKNPDSGVSSGNDTYDRVYLLSISEFNQYLTSQSMRKIDESSTDSWLWCLRTSSIRSEWAQTDENGNTTSGKKYCPAVVDLDGILFTSALTECDMDYAIRPVIWIEPWG